MRHRCSQELNWNALFLTCLTDFRISNWLIDIVEVIGGNELNNSHNDLRNDQSSILFSQNLYLYHKLKFMSKIKSCKKLYWNNLILIFSDWMLSCIWVPCSHLIESLLRVVKRIFFFTFVYVKSLSIIYSALVVYSLYCTKVRTHR